MKAPHPLDPEQFGHRLRQLMRESGYKASPTVLANAFNLLYWGEGITSHAARNWLNGVSLPKPDKLLVLANWLQVQPQYLMFGEEFTNFDPHISEDTPKEPITLADDTMLDKYQTLAHEHRRVVREVVAGLYLLRAQQQALIASQVTGSGKKRSNARNTRRIESS